MRLAIGFVVTAILALPGPDRGAAQSSPTYGAEAAPEAAVTIPVVERFDPTTGRRTRRTVAELSSREFVSIQQALARAGSDPGVRSGTLDPATRSALSAFERARGLAPCGCPSYATVVALGLEPRVVETVVAEGGRELAFAHPTAGPAEIVSSGRTRAPAATAPLVRSGPGRHGPVSVTTEGGVVVVRGSGSGSADGITGRELAADSARAASRRGAVGAESSAPAWPGYGAYFEPLYGGWVVPRGRRGGRRGPVHPDAPRPGAAGGAPAPVGRRPIPYAPRLPEPRPAAPGLPPSLPPAPGSGGGGS